MSDIEQRLREQGDIEERLRLPISESMFVRRSDMLRALFAERAEAADEIARLEADNASLRSKLEEAEGALEPFAEAGKAMLLTGGKNPKLSGHRLAEHLECARRTLASLREADHA